MDNIRALIVDDSSVMRKIVERSLRQAGLGIAQILEAGNGAEALAAVQANKVEPYSLRYQHAGHGRVGNSPASRTPREFR